MTTYSGSVRTFYRQGNTGDFGASTRLIVIGINSFQDLNDNGNVPHAVFHFRLGVMNGSATVGNYAGSAMQNFFNDATIFENGAPKGFLAGLIEAGIPEALIWAPNRVIANGCGNATGPVTITDKVWLHTEYEVFGSTTKGYPEYEDSSNQASFPWFEGNNNGNSNRIKYYPSGTPSSSMPEFGTEIQSVTATANMLGSPAKQQSNLCSVTTSGVINDGTISATRCYTPSFCIGGTAAP
jgi:hypothetical protein